MWICIIALTCQVVLVEPGPRYSSRIVDTQAGPLRGVSLLSTTSYTYHYIKFETKSNHLKAGMFTALGVIFSEECKLAIDPLVFRLVDIISEIKTGYINNNTVTFWR